MKWIVFTIILVFQVCLFSLTVYKITNSEQSKNIQYAEIAIALLVLFGIITATTYKVAGDKIVNQKLSESDKEEIVTRIAERLEPQLSKQYSGAHTVFGITRDGLVVPGGLVSENIKVFWDTGKVHSISDDKVLITIPDIIPYNGMRIEGNITPLARRLGAKSGPLISVGGVSPIVEIIGIQGDLVVVALGFEAKKETQ